MYHFILVIMSQVVLSVNKIATTENLIDILMKLVFGIAFQKRFEKI